MFLLRAVPPSLFFSSSHLTAQNWRHLRLFLHIFFHRRHPHQPSPTQHFSIEVPQNISTPTLLNYIMVSRSTDFEALKLGKVWSGIFSFSQYFIGALPDLCFKTVLTLIADVLCVITHETVRADLEVASQFRTSQLTDFSSPFFILQSWRLLDNSEKLFRLLFSSALSYYFLSWDINLKVTVIKGSDEYSTEIGNGLKRYNWTNIITPQAILRNLVDICILLANQSFIHSSFKNSTKWIFRRNRKFCSRLSVFRYFY